MSDMKTNTKRILTLISLLLLICTILVGCTEDVQSEETTSALTEIVTTEALETEAPAPQFYDIVKDGVCLFKLVYPADLPSDAAESKAALSIRKALDKYTTSSADIGDDWIKDGESYDSEKYEILVGFTGHSEVTEAAQGVGYGDYAIKTIGNKIILLSHSDEGYTNAVNRFVSLLYNGRTENTDGTSDITLSAENLNGTFTFEKIASAVPTYDGGTSFTALDISSDCFGIIIEGTTPEEYKKYLDALAADGYKTHTTNDIAGSLFATVYTEEYTVNAGYYNNMDEVRIIIEAYEDDTLAPLKSDAAPVTTSQITMLGVDGIYNGSYQNNGMSLIYRLSDGSFVVIDGGHQGNSAIYAAQIIKELREQSKAYAKTDKDIRIACWILTHPHTDHHGMLLQEYKQFTKFTFESIMCSFWTQEAFQESKNTSADFASGTWKGYLRSKDIAAEIGADFVIPHVGQVFWYGDTAFEMLYTIESYMPKVATGFNTCSLVFRTTTTDASGKSTTVLITGDATGHALEVCTTMYGKALASDIVQVSHHGAGTGGANTQTTNAYTLMKPYVLLWPAGTHNYADKAKKAWTQVLTSNRNPNYTELYISGWQGNAVTLPLPYTLGTAIINEVLEP